MCVKIAAMYRPLVLPDVCCAADSLQYCAGGSWLVFCATILQLTSPEVCWSCHAAHLYHVKGLQLW